MVHVAATKGQKGMVLVAVLWIVTALSLIVSATLASTRIATSVMQSEMAAARVRGLADAGIELAAYRLREASPERWYPDGRAYRTRFAGATLSIRIYDASGLIDLNRTEPDLLRAFLEETVTSKRVARRVTEFVVSRRERASTKPFRIEADATDEKVSDDVFAFSERGQLLLAPTMTHADYAEVKPYLTVHNPRNKLNPLTAPSRLLEKLPGMNALQIAALERARGKKDEIKDVLDALPNSTKAYLEPGEGPAYRIDIELHDEAFRRPVHASATILIKESGEAPYYGLSWEPLDF